jgi:hypothetical protein
MKKISFITLIISCLWVGNVYAVPINVEVLHGTSTEYAYFGDYNGGQWVTVYTDYSLSTDRYGSIIKDAFCVEGVASGSGSQLYEQISVPANLYNAAWVADQYWHNDSWSLTKEETQIIIWELAIDGNGRDNAGFNFATGYFQYNGSKLADLTFFYLNTILPNVIDPPTFSGVELVYNPIGPYNEYPEAFQDFLIDPVPEPTTILLFGIGVLGIGALGRKRFLNRNRG